MFDRIEVDVITMPFKIDLVTQGVLPIPPLPDPAFRFALPARRATLAHLNASREFCFDQPPPSSEIRVARRQCPDRVQVVGQDHYRVQTERVARPRITNRASQ